MKLIKLLAASIILNISMCVAGDTTLVTKAFLQTELEKSNKKIDSVATTTKELKDSLDRKTFQSIQDSSLFTAWEAAKKNPCPLYNGKCGNCLPNLKSCNDNPFIIKIITWILLAIILFLSFKYFINSALCKDESFTDGSGQLNMRPPKERPYSYSRTQLFWWSMIVFFCYGIFFALYGTLLPLNPTCVLLLGGGLATQLLGKTIDKNQIDKTVTGTGENAIPNPTRHQDTTSSKGLLTDILSDENGISIHRLQSVIFNIIYGIGFISYFIKYMDCCQYPLIDFEGWQLTLLGISMAGYLGMKTTENSKATEPARIAEAEKNAGEKGPTEQNTTSRGQG